MTRQKQAAQLMANILLLGERHRINQQRSSELRFPPGGKPPHRNRPKMHASLWGSESFVRKGGRELPAGRRDAKQGGICARAEVREERAAVVLLGRHDTQPDVWIHVEAAVPGMVPVAGGDDQQLARRLPMIDFRGDELARRSSNAHVADARRG
jgi:hypothetical protein